MAGLPKTGTSTLAVMLRILGYSVSGPEIHFNKGNSELLESLYSQYNAFQDYPWCFEWQQFKNDQQVKFIVLYRNSEFWLQSFYKSYGKGQEKYLSFPYMGISKIEENKREFLEFFDQYYGRLAAASKDEAHQFLFVDIKSITWDKLCVFLNEKVPTDLWGRVSQIPHANKKNFKNRESNRYKYKKLLKGWLLKILGEDLYFKISNLINRN